MKNILVTLLVCSILVFSCTEGKSTAKLSNTSTTDTLVGSYTILSPDSSIIAYQTDTIIYKDTDIIVQGYNMTARALYYHCPCGKSDIILPPYIVIENNKNLFD